MVLFNKLITKAQIRLRGCAGWSAQMRRLVCAFVVRKLPKTGFLASRPIFELMDYVPISIFTVIPLIIESAYDLKLHSL